MGMIYSQLFLKPAYPTSSFAGQTVIVTGSNVGLGKEAARHLARLGVSKLILAVRNVKAGEEAKHDIEKTTKCASSVIEVWPLDLSSYASVKTFAKRAAQLPRLDVLLENAGIATFQHNVMEGHESTITVNVISTFLLALLLLPKLKESAKQNGIQPRLVIVSSEVHGFAKFPEWREPDIFVNLDKYTNKQRDERYPLSKLLEVLTVRKIAPRLEGSNVILNILNPGLCESSLSREAGTFHPVTIMKFLLARTTEVGSRTLIASAAAGSESHGKYMSDGKIKEEGLSKFVRSEDGRVAADRVWKELSEILEDIEPGVTKNI